MQKKYHVDAKETHKKVRPISPEHYKALFSRRRIAFAFIKKSDSSPFLYAGVNQKPTHDPMNHRSVFIIHPARKARARFCFRNLRKDR